MSIRLSSPDKVLWPGAGPDGSDLTKADLFAYAEDASARLLVQLRDRPLSLKRFPKGVTGKGFFQKDLPDHAPESIRRWRVWAESADREVAYALIDDIDGLRWLAQQNTIELHPALLRVDRPERADSVVFDIDPPKTATSPSTAASSRRRTQTDSQNALPPGRVAGWVREVLVELGLSSLVKTSGGRGLHVIIPIERRYDAELLRPFTLAIARMVAERHPDELTVEMRKADRGGRTLVDWSRGGSSTLIAAWSPRAHPAATVAMPLHWDEVDDDLDPTAFTLVNAMDRPDVWAGSAAVDPQRIERAVTAIAEAGIDLVDASPRDVTANALSRGGTVHGTRNN